MKLGLIITVLVLSAFAAPAISQDTGTKSDPIEITADKSLEWHRNDRKYVANGNAVIVQGSTTIRADRIVADYRDGGSKGMEIFRMTATGNIRVDNQGNTATGETLIYDVPSGIATLSGSGLSMSSPDQVVTATEKMEYDVKAGKLHAIGNAKVVRGEDTLTAGRIAAILADDGHGRRALKQMEAHENVIITTQTETLRGDHAIYKADSNTADVTGNVRISRGPSELTGDRATVNLTTNVSSLFGSMDPAGNGGRVRGVFYPDGASPQ